MFCTGLVGLVISTIHTVSQLDRYQRSEAAYLDVQYLKVNKRSL